MRGVPGFLTTLQVQLESLPISILERVNRPGGIEIRDLIDYILHPRDHTVDRPDNVEPDVYYDEITQEIRRLGSEALKDGSTAYCILAGGVGTRLGLSKNFINLPGTSTSLLGLKLIQSEGIRDVWVMTSPRNRLEVEALINKFGRRDVKVFDQYESFRLTLHNSLHFVDESPSLHPCGHGDVIPALKHSGLMRDFVARGGKRIIFVNVDNLYAAPEPAVLGQHISSGAPVTCEVVNKESGDVGGVLCSHVGFRQIVERFRLSPETNPNDFKWLNTNTMIIDACLDFDTIKWAWHRVKKNVEGQLLVQYERLLQDVTSHFKTHFVGVTRSHRYIPVKTSDDLVRASDVLIRRSA